MSNRVGDNIAPAQMPEGSVTLRPHLAGKYDGSTIHAPKPPEVSPVCLHCHWWKEWVRQPDAAKLYGECHYHPPKLGYDKKGNELSRRASTPSTDACGQWRPRKTE